jgi:sec-independent protein translocase protein TatA
MIRFEMNSLVAISAPGWPEIMVIMFFVLVFFGAKRLPELARSLGQSMQEFRKAKDEFHRELNRPAEELAAQPAKDKETAVRPS